MINRKSFSATYGAVDGQLERNENDAMRRFIDMLHAEGVDEYISLPEIAVMGDTSSGKSSLLSAISGIPLPASEQLTTRCPLRLRMEKDVVRKASVSIRWHSSSAAYRDDIAYSARTGITEDELGDQFLTSITEEIKKAQVAVIDASKKEVARDIIEVEVYGPDCYDLTLIDLPGIVRVAGKHESETIIEDIQLLIKEYLENERCVVLCVHPANVDFHNSGIIADAKKYDPETCRTIPVITKPDLIDRGAERGVLELLLGHRMETFKEGFHMVKCRGQQQLNDGLDLEAGMQAEQRFFASEDPWRRESQKSPKLFGIPALRSKLTGLQLRMINDSIPSILADILKQTADAEAEYQKLGELVNTSYERRHCFQGAVNKALTALKAEQAGHSSGRTGRSSVAQQQDAFDEFGKQMHSTRLANISHFEVGTKVLVVTGSGKEEAGKVVSLSADGAFVHVLPDAFSDISSTSLLGTAQNGNSESLHFTEVGSLYGCNDNSCVMCRNGGVGSACWVLASPSRNGKAHRIRRFNKIHAVDVRRDPTWLEELIRDHRNNDLDCFLSPALFNSIVAGMVMEDWEPLCLELLDSTRDALLANINAVFLKLLPTRYPRMVAYVTDCIASVLEESYATTKTAVVDHLIKNKQPYTQNHYLYEMINKKRNELLERRIVNALEGSGVTITAAAAVAIVRGTLGTNERKSILQHVTEEMVIVLDAYGKLAVKRVIDDVRV